MQKKQPETYHNVQVRLPWAVGLLLEEEARQLHESLGTYLAKAAYSRFNLELLTGVVNRGDTELYKYMIRAGREFVKNPPKNPPKYKTAQARVPLADGALIEEEARSIGESMGLYFLKAGFERYGHDIMTMRFDRLPSVILAGVKQENKNRAARLAALKKKAGGRA